MFRLLRNAELHAPEPLGCMDLLTRQGRFVPGFVDADADLVVLDDEGLPTDLMAAGEWHLRERVELVRGPFEGGREDASP